MSVPHEEARLIRIASRRTGIPAHVLAGLTEIESGFNADARSPAGAEGETQFMPGTAPTYGVQFGHSHHAKATQFIGAGKYLRALMKGGKGLRWALAAYNGGPGNPQFGYADKVLQASRKYKGIDKGGQRSSATSTTTKRIPGIDNSGTRRDLKLNYLATEDSDPDALLTLGLGLKNATDVPGRSVTTTRTVRGGSSAGGLYADSLHKAIKWDRAGVKYQWGGGHGSIAKPGQEVDCSGFWSALAPGVTHPMVSGDFMNYGKPGVGKHMTIYASSTHVFGWIRDGKGRKRWFGTSKSNPGGGAGEISPPSAEYLSRFVARHPN